MSLRLVLLLMLGAWCGGIACSEGSTAWAEGSATTWVWLSAAWVLAVLLILTLHHLTRTHRITTW